MDLYSYLMSLHLNRYLLAFIFIPVIQKETDIFRETVWNSHRVRIQKDAEMPKGIPYHLYTHFLSNTMQMSVVWLIY